MSQQAELPEYASWDDGYEDDDEAVCDAEAAAKAAAKAGPEQGEGEEDEPENQVPEWANRPEAVPPQDYSFVSRAAFELRSLPTVIPLPPGFGSGKRRRDGDDASGLDLTTKRPVFQQTALVRDAWMALAADIVNVRLTLNSVWVPAPAAVPSVRLATVLFTSSATV